MNKQVAYGYSEGMMKDVSKSKHPQSAYYDAKNIRIINTDSQSTYSVTNEKGHSLKITLPSITINGSENRIEYNNSNLSFVNTSGNELLNSSLPSTSTTQQIIGHTTTRNSIILFSTDNLGFDCIWEVTDIFNDTFDLVLLYCRDLNFSTSKPIQCIYNYENDTLEKIYWVDGINQLRFINLRHSKANGDAENLIDLKSTNVNIVSDYSLSQPVLTDTLSGGTHTAGMIQYAYNLYRLSGAQTTLSPFSELISLDRGSVLGGGEVNEVVGATPFVNIPTLDTNFTHIKVYAIKYTSFNETPSISLIEDEKIDTYTNYSFTDDGGTISTLSLSEFLFLGSNPVSPQHIETKDNRLFAVNYRENAYELDIDCRAYSHDSTGATKLYTGNVSYINGALTGANDTFLAGAAISSYNYAITKDAINPNYDTYKYQKDGSTLGGEGLYIKYRLVGRYNNTTASELFRLEGDLKYLKFFKSDEIYRIGIIFYNKLGQKTDVKWIADFKAPFNNLAKVYNTLDVEIKTTEFNTYIDSLNLDDDKKPVGYKIVRAQRDIKDMTILCQGSLTGMMFQVTEDPSNYQKWNVDSEGEAVAKDYVKVPVGISRGFTVRSTETALQPTQHMRRLSGGSSFTENNTEIYSDVDDRFKRQHTWQYTKMVQMHSPDVLFNNGLSFSAGLKIRSKGIALLNRSDVVIKRYWNESQTIGAEFDKYNTDDLIIGQKPYFGLIGPIHDGTEHDISEFTAFHNQYNTFASGTSKELSIYRIPEISERGQGPKAYNGDSNFKYSNTLEGVISDRKKSFNTFGGDEEEEVRGLNSHGSQCAVIVLGTDGQAELDRPKLEDLVPNDISNTNGLLIGEVVRPDSYRYSGSMYNGLSTEDKARTIYVEIGTYKDITDNYIKIMSPGDTFVQSYKLARISKTDTQVFDNTKPQFTEIIEFPIETTVNLLNRSDISLLSWDNKHQPTYNEFHNYNRVYSQSSNLVLNTTDSLKIRDVNKFDTKIISSKLKLANETIDSWTDFLENETMDLDGKYGSINGTVNFNDNIFVFQDTAVAALQINPRVQTQASDGLSIELGTGSILYDYNYLTTTSGTLNKWSIVRSSTGFYYYDIINKALYKFSSKLDPISTSGGHHEFFQNNFDYSKLIVDNPLLLQGVTGGYDEVNKEALFTFLQGDKSFSIGYNDKKGGFTSQYDALPNMYITKGSVVTSVDTNNNKLYKHFDGDYNVYHGTNYPSSITLLLNPETNLDCVFDNIEYNSELYINDIDQPEKTLTHIQAYNEYQDSGRIPLVVGRNSNLRRKFRKWRANIPRDGRNRIRNPWVFLKLELDNSTNQQLILHDIIVSYTV